MKMRVEINFKAQTLCYFACTLKSIIHNIYSSH